MSFLNAENIRVQGRRRRSCSRCCGGGMQRPLAHHHSLQPALLLRARPSDSLVSWALCFLSRDPCLQMKSWALHPSVFFLSFLPPTTTTHPSQTSHRRRRRRGRRASYASARLIKTRASAQTAPLNQGPENVCELNVSMGLFCFSFIHELGGGVVRRGGGECCMANTLFEATRPQELLKTQRLRKCDTI